jgi:glycosyltransferase involved in cell wall biosynthesis
MLKNQSIVCFAPDPWEDLWRNRHRFLSLLARDNRVLYVEPRATARSLLRGLREGRFRARDLFRSRVEAVRENLFVYHDPLHLPRTRRRCVGPLIERLRLSILRRCLRRLEMQSPILWLVRPEAGDMPGLLGEKLVLYQIVDDYLAYPGVTEQARARLDREERALGGKADLVVVTSDHLREAKSHLGRHLEVVRNGVDGHTLEEGSVDGGELPREAARWRHPVCGYIGGITEKLDFALLETLAAELASLGGTLVFVGDVRVNGNEAAESVRRLRALPHVVFTGRRAASMVPQYIRAFDVGLIPYREGRQARAIDPLKLYEYLAFGKPTVSVDIPSVRSFRDVIRIAADRVDFIEQVRSAASEKDAQLASRRRSVARENSWEKRAEQLSHAIVEALDRKR